MSALSLLYTPSLSRSATAQLTTRSLFRATPSLYMCHMPPFCLSTGLSLQGMTCPRSSSIPHPPSPLPYIRPRFRSAYNIPLSSILRQRHTYTAPESYISQPLSRCRKILSPPAPSSPRTGSLPLF